jgi:hypothetical protein
MPDDRREPNRFLGFPVRAGFGERTSPRAEQHEESQRFMGFPVDWFSGPDLGWLDSLAHPVRTCQRWLRRQRLGPYEDRPRR